MVKPGEEPEPYEPVAGLELPPMQTPVLSSEAGLFSLTSADLKDVRVWREAPIIEIHETVGSNGKIKKVRKRVGRIRIMASGARILDRAYRRPQTQGSRHRRDRGISAIRGAG